MRPRKFYFPQIFLSTRTRIYPMVVSYLPSSILACLDRPKTNPKIGFIHHPFDASELQTKQAQRSYSNNSKHSTLRKNSCFHQDPSKISCWSHFQTTIHPFRSNGQFILSWPFLETPKAMPFLKPKKTVVITGASSGLGLAAAKSLAEQGWQVPWCQGKNPSTTQQKCLKCSENVGFYYSLRFGMCLKVMIIRILSTMRFIAIRSSQEKICGFWFTFFHQIHTHGGTPKNDTNTFINSLQSSIWWADSKKKQENSGRFLPQLLDDFSFARSGMTSLFVENSSFLSCWPFICRIRSESLPSLLGGSGPRI